jgi:hypothetical protein
VRSVIRASGHLFDVRERHGLWVKIMSDQMKDHIVGCGLGYVGGVSSRGCAKPVGVPLSLQFRIKRRYVNCAPSAGSSS